MMDNTLYNNPLVTRYASKEMSGLLSEQNRIGLFRRLWTALAASQMELGLNITKEQVDELAANVDNINFDVAAERERIVRHDVMAHIYAYSQQCPKAAPIIHLGATSCYVTDNADLIIYHDGLKLLLEKIAGVMANLARFALENKSLACLGFTHLQPAQLTTVGKRATLWLQDFLLDYNSISDFLSDFMLRGVKGTTGTQASFLKLFDGDHDKVNLLQQKVLEKMGFGKAFGVTGQTYTRKYDYSIASLLSMIAQSAAKFGNDIRLLQNMKEIEEPFEKNQIGSSAMAYKRNPMRCERICSLARYLVSLPANCAVTASTQWLERTLDDSANRRIVMGEALLAADAILELTLNVTNGLVVYPKVIKKHIDMELPFMATEDILMQCVKAGGDRQKLHELIRTHSMEAAKLVKEEGKSNDLIERIKQDKNFAAVHSQLEDILSAWNFIGRSPEQVEEFISLNIRPILSKHTLKQGGEIKV
jgi:adenylosuccinate lyase